jgi:hypothetical protein
MKIVMKTQKKTRRMMFLEIMILKSRKFYQKVRVQTNPTQIHLQILKGHNSLDKVMKTMKYK